MDAGLEVLGIQETFQHSMSALPIKAIFLLGVHPGQPGFLECQYLFKASNL